MVEVFPILPAPPRALWFCAGLVALFAATWGLCLWRERRASAASPRRTAAVWVLRGVLGLLLGLQGVFVYTAWWSQRARVEVRDDAIAIVGDYGRKLVPLASLDPARARVVDASTPELLPRSRSWGTALPGWSSGWFRLRNGEDALAYVGDAPPLYLPSSEGFALLLGLAEPERFLERLRRSRPRGVVLVVVDTLRADHLGAYGYERPTSPRIDAFAADAVRFADATSPAPWTLPALATLMTSLYPSVHGAHSPSNLKDTTWYFQPREFRAFSSLAESRLTLAEILAQAGFATWGAVQGSYPTRAFGMSQGFETYRENATPGIRFDVEDALAWLDDARPERFLVYLHVGEVHSPYTPVAIRAGSHRKFDPGRSSYYEEAVAEERLRLQQWRFDPDYRGPVEGTRADLVRLSRPGAPRRDVQHLVALYDRGIAYVDHWFGELLDGLRERGLDGDTIVVLTSDHGEEFLEHGRLEHSYSYYEEMLRVPLVVRVPGVPPAVVEETVGLVDVLPTLLELLGVDAPPGLQGRSLRTALAGGAGASGEYVGEASYRKGSAALRGAGWKYIRSGRGREELYDLASDPAERVNLCDTRPQECARHRDRLEARTASHRELARGLSRPEAAVIDADTRAELEALGYLDPLESDPDSANDPD